MRCRRMHVQMLCCMRSSICTIRLMKRREDLCRDELQALRDKANELEIKIDKEINMLKAAVEARATPSFVLLRPSTRMLVVWLIPSPDAFLPLRRCPARPDHQERDH